MGWLSRSLHERPRTWLDVIVLSAICLVVRLLWLRVLSTPGDYRCLGNMDATWFVGPPYQFQKLYVHNNIDYSELSEWCKSRGGQVIVCENSKADWMDFTPLVELSGQRTRTMEVIWTQESFSVKKDLECLLPVSTKSAT